MIGGAQAVGAPALGRPGFAFRRFGRQAGWPGVWEARIDYGPGYRVYYARADSHLIVLLIGGDKRKQKADIENAVIYWNDWQERNQK